MTRAHFDAVILQIQSNQTESREDMSVIRQDLKKVLELVSNLGRD